MTWEYDDEEEKWDGKGGHHCITIVQLKIDPFCWESKESHIRTLVRFERKVVGQWSIKGNWAWRKGQTGQGEIHKHKCEFLEQMTWVELNWKSNIR